MTELIKHDEYREWVVSIKSLMQASQMKAAVAVNHAMLELHWFLREYQVAANLPEQLKYSVLSIEQTEAELDGINDE